jgi:hypothetical protein
MLMVFVFGGSGLYPSPHNRVVALQDTQIESSFTASAHSAVL